jgi:hypothetical protein
VNGNEGKSFEGTGTICHFLLFMVEKAFAEVNSGMGRRAGGKK